MLLPYTQSLHAITTQILQLCLMSWKKKDFVSFAVHIWLISVTTFWGVLRGVMCGRGNEVSLFPHSQVSWWGFLHSCNFCGELFSSELFAGELFSGIHARRPAFPNRSVCLNLRDYTWCESALAPPSPTTFLHSDGTALHLDCTPGVLFAPPDFWIGIREHK